MNFRKVISDLFKSIVDGAVKALSKDLYKQALISILKKYIGATGFAGLVVGFVVPKLVKFGIIELKDLDQTIKDKDVVDEFKKEIQKPADQIDKEKRDKLEEDILTGK